MKLKGNLKKRLILGIFLGIVLTILLVGIFHFNTIKSFIESSIASYGLLAILLFCFIADLTEQPLGPEIPASVGVLLGMNFPLVILIAFIGSYGGSIINYYIGKNLLNKNITDAFGFKIKNKHYKLFHKHGKWGLSLAAISPIPWVTFCWLAGYFKMKLRDFALYGMGFRFLRILTIAGLVKYFQIILF